MSHAAKRQPLSLLTARWHRPLSTVTTHRCSCCPPSPNVSQYRRPLAANCRPLTLTATHGVTLTAISHEAMYMNMLLSMGASDPIDRWGIVGIGLMPWDNKMREVLEAQDFCYTLVTRSPPGSKAQVVLMPWLYFAPYVTQTPQKPSLFSPMLFQLRVLGDWLHRGLRVRPRRSQSLRRAPG